MEITANTPSNYAPSQLKNMSAKEQFKKALKQPKQ